MGKNMKMMTSRSIVQKVGSKWRKKFKEHLNKMVWQKR